MEPALSLHDTYMECTERLNNAYKTPTWGLYAARMKPACKPPCGLHWAYMWLTCRLHGAHMEPTCSLQHAYRTPTGRVHDAGMGPAWGLHGTYMGSTWNLQNAYSTPT